ncbi:hypothetical protein [Brevibacillus choshinensis]|uniref:hypothetical protein n=1 Tax=Brevibacillus choshinensis TaxID=54911 RepID=UPI0006EC1C57|nr:hypothetical protein [Brevibacillus choshinensis]
MKITTILVTLLLLINTNTQQEQQQDSTAVQNKQFTGDCVAKIYEFDPALMWGNVKYRKKEGFDPKGLERGKIIGEVKFKVNGNVCFGYTMKNGDATSSVEGTPIYQVNGYSEQFRLFVGEDLYEVTDNPYAKTLGDFFDIQGKVNKVKIEYPIENSPSIEISEEAKKQFIEDFLKVDYVPFERIYKDSMFNSTKYFLRIHLNDGSNIVISYWPDENAFSQGYATEKMKKIILTNVEKLQSLSPP